MISADALNNVLGTDVYLAAWSASSPVAVSPDGVGYTTEDTTLYIYKLPNQVQGDAGGVQITPGYTLWSLSSASTQRDYSPYGLYLTTNDQAAFRFMPLPSVHLATVDALTLNTDTNARSATFSLWDWPKSAWVDLDSAQFKLLDNSRAVYDINDAGDIQRFMGPGNAVQVRITPSTASINYSKIDVTFHGTLEPPVKS